MSQKLTLVQHEGFSTTGHIFCFDCAVELNIVMDNVSCYLNPQYSIDWDLEWHEFYNVKHICPELVKSIWNEDYEAECPCCGNKNIKKLKPLDNSMFDIELIQRSLDSEGKYHCSRCENKFASQKCVIRTGRHEYICGDCAAFA